MFSAHNSSPICDYTIATYKELLSEDKSYLLFSSGSKNKELYNIFNREMERKESIVDAYIQHYE